MDELSIREIFPKKLQEYMLLNQKNRNDLVRDLKLKYSTVRDWEKGLTVPRMDKVELLANYFGCTPADLLQDTGSPTAANDGLSDSKRELLDFVQAVPDEKAALILQAMKLILEASE